MSYCPDCRVEYEERVAICTDCGRPLRAGSMPAAPEAPVSEEKWTALMRVRTQESAEIIRGLLENEEIECEVIDKRFSEMPVPVEPVSYLEIWVPESLAAEARGVLNAAREGTVACRACGHMSAAEEPSCEYCGAAV